MRVRVLGHFEIQGHTPAELGSRKGRTLLKILALADGAPVATDRLIDALWPDAAPSEPADQVSVLVSRARGVLGADRIARSEGGYLLVADWLDLAELRILAAEGERLLATGDVAAARSVGLAGLGLSRGPLLRDDPDAPWASSDRILAERLTSRLRRLTASACLATRDLVGALDAALAALDAEPLDEDALRLGMRALALSGRPALALDLHERTRIHLRDLLGVSPAPETDALHGAILRGELTGAGPADRAGTHRTVLTSAGGETAFPPIGGVGSDAIRDPLLQPPPGRGAELAALTAAFVATAERGLGVAAVTGEAGIGKSRLMTGFGAVAAAAGATVLSGRCQQHGRPLPLQAVLDAVRVGMRRAPGGDAARWLGADAALLTPHLGGDPPRSDGLLAMPDPDLARGLLGLALLGVLERMAEPAGVVLLLDDVQDADPGTLEWLGTVHRRRPAARVLVVVGARGERPPVDADQVIHLLPLDLAAVREVVGPERAQTLLERSGGNPLFLVELAAHPDPDAGTVLLPPTLRDLIAARCAALGDETAATVRAAALLGSAIDVDLVAAVRGRPTLDILTHLEAATRAGLVSDGPDGLRLRHALIGDAIALDVGAARRALLHRDAARVLAARDPVDFAGLAHHARLGGDIRLAATGLVGAARLATERADHAEALRLLDDAVALDPTPEARLERARVHLLNGQYVEAESDALATRRTGTEAAALEVSGFAAYYRRDLQRARLLASEGAATASDPVVRAGCLLLGGRVAIAMGETAEAEGLLVEAAALAADQGIEVPGTWLAMVRTHQGRPLEALALLRAAGHRRLPSHAFAPVHLHFVTAHAMGTAGRPEGALAALRLLDEEVARRGLARFGGRAANLRGWVLRNLGRPDDADEENRRGEREAVAAGSVEARAHALLDLADGALQRGDTAAAALSLDAAGELQSVEHGFRWRHGLRGELLRGRLALLLDDPDGASDAARGVAAEAALRGADRYVVLAGLLAVRAAARSGAPVDRVALDALLRRLPDVAGLEAWWLTAEVAADLDWPVWRDAAGAAAARLAGNAGTAGPAFLRYAATRLESIRTRGRSG